MPEKAIRPEKKAIVNELRASLADAAFVMLADYRGLKVQPLQELRRQLTRLGAKLHIVKNSFLKLALAAERREQLGDVLTTPTAVIVGSGDLVRAAKVLESFQQEQRVLSFKRGFWDGRTLSSEEFSRLLKLPPRPVLLSLLLGTMASPMAHLVGVFNQKLASLVYVLKAVQEKKTGAVGAGDKPAAT